MTIRLAALASLLALAACNELHVGVGAGQPCAADVDCATGLVCAGKVCAVPESTADCSPGAKRCDGRRVLVCVRDGSGFAEESTCEGGCAEGACLERLCEPGHLACDGDALVRCAPDGRTQERVEHCDLGCDAGTKACRSAVCRPGETRCADANKAVEKCDERGAGWVRTACDATSPARCESAEGPSGASATCVPLACEPGTKRCDGAKIVVCNSDGRGERVLSTCETGCAEAACVAPACAAGAKRCAGDAIEICAPDRSGFVLSESCASGCTAEGGSARCRPIVCGALSTRCGTNGTSVETCTADGLSWGAPAACAAGEVCTEGRCVAPAMATCVDGATRCSGSRVETCSGNVFRATAACLGTCREGACDARGECTPLVLDVPLLGANEALAADGASTVLVVSRPIVSSNGTPLPDGAPVTIALRATDADLAPALLSPDSDGALAGVQVPVLDGRIDFTFRAAKSLTRDVTATVTAQLPGQPHCAGTTTVRFSPITSDRIIGEDFLTSRARDASRGSGATWDVRNGTLKVDPFDAGDGRDGALVVAQGETVDLGARVQAGRGFADMASARVLEVRGNRLTIEGSSSAFGAGTRVLVVNVRGAAGKTSRVGTWELATVAGEERGLLELTAPLARVFGEPDNTAAGLSSQSVRLIRVPQYSRVSIDGTVTGPAFDGAAGGVLAFLAQSQETSGEGRNRLGATGLVTMKGRGYRGASAPAAPTTSATGESLAGGRDTASKDPQLGAGGGGYECGNGIAPVVTGIPPPPGNSASAFFGSAGSHATAGESSCTRAGQPYGASNQLKLFFGSGSGSQHESVYFACPQYKECCTQWKACRCDQYASCCTGYNSCCTQYNTCCTKYNSCCYQYKSCCRLYKSGCLQYKHCENSACGCCGKIFGICYDDCECRTAGCGCETSGRDARFGCEPGYDGRHVDCGCESTGEHSSCGCAPDMNKPDPTCGCAPGKDGPQVGCGCAPGKDGPQAACGCAIPLARDPNCGCEAGAYKRDAMCGCEPREDRWKHAHAGANGGGLVFIVAGALDLSENGARIDASGEDPAKGLFGGAGGTVVVKTPRLALGGAGRIVATGGARAGTGRVLLEVGALEAGFADEWIAPVATRSPLELPAAWSVKLADLSGARQLRVFALPRGFGGTASSGAIDALAALAALGGELRVATDGTTFVAIPPESSMALTNPASLHWTLRAGPGMTPVSLRALAFRAGAPP